VIVAAEDRTDPAALATMTVYDPAAEVETFERANWLAVAPSIATPLRRHWYVSGAVPEAVTARVCEPPTASAAPAGCAVREGALAPVATGEKTRLADETCCWREMPFSE